MFRIVSVTESGIAFWNGEKFIPESTWKYYSTERGAVNAARKIRQKLSCPVEIKDRNDKTTRIMVVKNEIVYSACPKEWERWLEKEGYSR